MATRGPKEREINYEEVRLLSAIFCSEEEIAEKVGLSYIGLRYRKKKDPELLSAIKRGRGDGIRSLRALQFQAAKRGSIPMLIWLGKQYLGQSDKMLPAPGPTKPATATPTDAAPVKLRRVTRRGIHLGAPPPAS